MVSTGRRPGHQHPATLCLPHAQPCPLAPAFPARVLTITKYVVPGPRMWGQHLVTRGQLLVTRGLWRPTNGNGSQNRMPVEVAAAREDGGGQTGRPGPQGWELFWKAHCRLPLLQVCRRLEAVGRLAPLLLCPSLLLSPQAQDPLPSGLPPPGPGVLQTQLPRGDGPPFGPPFPLPEKQECSQLGTGLSAPWGACSCGWLAEAMLRAERRGWGPDAGSPQTHVISMLFPRSPTHGHGAIPVRKPHAPLCSLPSRANVAQQPRDPPDHMEDRGVHGDQRVAGAGARHPGQDVPDQVQGPLSPQVSAGVQHL